MTKDDIRALVLRTLGEIAPEAPLDTIGAKDDLRETLDLDSLDFLQLVRALAKQTGVAIPEGAYREVRSLDACVEYLASHGA